MTTVCSLRQQLTPSYHDVITHAKQSKHLTADVLAVSPTSSADISMFLFFSNTLQITIVKYYFQRQHSLSAFLLVLQSRLSLASWPAAADHVTSSRDRDIPPTPEDA